MNPRLVAILCVVLPVTAAFARHHQHEAGSGVSGRFDYYLLSLAWAPNYCHDHPSDHSPECRGRQGFVLHGLWPQAEKGAPPLACAPCGPVSASLLDSMLQYFPSRGLIEHEWQEHGTCSGLSPDKYFRLAAQAYQRVQVPESFREPYRELDLSVSDLERSFTEANHAPAGAVRVSCHNGRLVNLEVCFTKDLQFRACSPSVRECPENKISLLPPE